jgi:hypothetical protein
MINVFVVFTGQNSRTTIPGAPFATHQQAHTELFNYGVNRAGTWPQFLGQIDEYGFEFPNGVVISIPTKP